MQTSRDRGLAKRVRLYGAHMDVDQLKRGRKYDELKPCYVIFICKFDPFRKGLYRYSFENICAEDHGLKLNDGSHKLFFNTTGTKGDIGEKLRNLLKYMNNAKEFNVKKVNDPLIEKIEQAVNMAKQDEDWRHEYMISQSQNRAIELHGIEIGKQLGEEYGRQLGEKYGRQIGEKYGRQIGEKYGRQIGERRGIERTARELLLMGLPIEDISKATHLTLAEIRELAAETKPQD